MLWPIWCVSQNIVQIVIRALGIMKDTAHQTAKCGWCIHETKRHYSESEKSSVADKCGEIPILLTHWDLPIPFTQIKLRTDHLTT